jgi:uncharacterized membrane protein YhaH (DUF805 family)
MLEKLMMAATDGTRYPNLFTLVGSYLLFASVACAIMNTAITKKRLSDIWHPIWVPLGTVAAIAGTMAIDHLRALA